MNDEFLKIILLMLMLLNPFLIIVYLTDLMKKKNQLSFIKLLFTAGFISILVFVTFSIVGEFIFTSLLQTEIASFQIFGGIVFLIIALQFMFRGEAAISNLRADSKNVSTSIAMPILVGPGTIGVSILAGKRLETFWSISAIIISVTISITIMILLKVLFDIISTKKENIIESYTEISGKVTALIVGTYSVDMIVKGIKSFIQGW